MEKQIEKLQESVDIIAKTTAHILENMVTKDSFEAFKLETNTHFSNLELDLKSFKKETSESIDEIKVDVADLADTDAHYDKRIEKLENKVFGTSALA